MSTKNVKENLADHLAIRDLMDRYTDAINQRDWQAVESVFTEDGIWDVGGEAVPEMCFYFVGGRKVAEGIAKTVGTTDLCFQTNHAAVIHVDGKFATARAAINEIARAKNGGPGVNLLGIYYDEIMLDADGEWRFKMRRFRYIYLEAPVLSGRVLPSPDLESFSPRSNDAL